MKRNASLKASPDQPIGSDICLCGDYRSQHGWRTAAYCRVCGNSTAPYDGCQAFRYARSSTDEEVKHWKRHHGKA